MDPARTNDLYHLLAFVHPVVAAAGLAGALLVLRAGLRLREGRQRRRPPPPEVNRFHLRWGPKVMWTLGAAFVLGVASAVLLRNMAPLRSFHGWISSTTLALFLWAAFWGRRLRGDPQRRRLLHGNLGLLAMFLAAIVAITGIALLP